LSGVENSNDLDMIGSDFINHDIRQGWDDQLMCALNGAQPA
jgi:hypothetical protein